MLSLSSLFSHPLPTVRPRNCRRSRLIPLLLATSTLLLLGSCTQSGSGLPTPLRSLLNFPAQSGASLQFQVAPAREPGIYSISGNSNFPEQSEIRVAAVRYLRRPHSTILALPAKPTYSILAYQTATIIDGKWQAELNLWQVAKDGRFQEAWQLQQPELKLAVEPAADVVFLATLAPGNQADPMQKLEQQLKKVGKQLDGGLVNSTAEGQRYIRVAHHLDVALPTGGTTPPPLKPADINGGWGNRFLIPPEPPIPYTLEFPNHRRTDAPAAAKEFLR